MKRFLIAVIFLSLAVLAAFGTLSRVTGDATDAEASRPKGQGSATTRILVLGRDRAAGLCDSIFVVSLQEESGRVSVVQIPRDTYANYTERDYRKLNGAAQVHGVEGMKNLLSDALGISIDHYAVLELSALQSIVDAVGGVDVTLPEELHYSDPEQGLQISLPSGRTHLDGRGAEQLVRFRSGYANADLGRLDAQKLFLQAFADRCRTLSPAHLMRLASLLLANVETDLDLAEGLRLTAFLQKADTAAIPMATLPGEAIRGNSGAWYYVLNREGALRTLNEYCMPATPIVDAEFDQNAFFDRADHPEFHKLYLAPDPASASE